MTNVCLNGNETDDSGHRIGRKPLAEIENAVRDLGTVVIELQDVVGKMRQVSTPQVVSHRSAGAARIDVACASPRHNVIVVDGAEIDAVPCNRRRVLDSLVQLRPRTR